MIKKRDAEAIMSLAISDFSKEIYLAKWYKMIFYFDLLTYKETGKRFFNFNYLVESTCPVPIDVHNLVVDGSLAVKYSELHFRNPKTKKLSVRNINCTKVACDPVIYNQKSSLNPKEEDRISRIKGLYGPALPSVMYEKDLVGKNFYKAEVAAGNFGKIIDMEVLLNKIPLDFPVKDKVITKKEI